MTETASHMLIDDCITVFQLEGLDGAEPSVRGRAVRLGGAIDKALGDNRYPVTVARLLGEAMMIGALVSNALKFKGRLVFTRRRDIFYDHRSRPRFG